jgi:hypothetical protein
VLKYILTGFICTANLSITLFEIILLTLSFAAFGVIPTAEANLCKEFWNL